MEVDFTAASAKIHSHTRELKNGQYTRTRQFGTTEETIVNGKVTNSKPAKVEVENKVAVSILGVYQRELGQSQKIDSDLKTSDYKTYTKENVVGGIYSTPEMLGKVSAGSIGITRSLVTETDLNNNVTQKEEHSFSLGLKLILGFEYKITVEPTKK